MAIAIPIHFFFDSKSSVRLDLCLKIYGNSSPNQGILACICGLYFFLQMLLIGIQYSWELVVCSPLCPFLIYQVLSTCQWLHVYKMVSNKTHKSKWTQWSALWKRISSLSFFCPSEGMGRDFCGWPLRNLAKPEWDNSCFLKKSVLLIDVFNTGFVLVLCCNLLIMLLPFTILLESSFFGKPEEYFFFLHRSIISNYCASF